MENVVIYFARQFVLLLNFVLSSSCSYERPLFGGGFLTPFKGVPMAMKLTRNDLLQAWMTLVKLRETGNLDVSDDQFVLTVLNILDREQHKRMETES